MVAEGRVTPEGMLDPEKGVEQRVVLLRRSQPGPDGAQPGKRTQADGGDVVAVVPDKAGLERRPVDDEAGEEEKRAEKPGRFREARVGGLNTLLTPADRKKCREFLNLRGVVDA